MQDVVEWVKFIRTDGLAVGLVVFACIVFILVLRWLGSNVAKPLTNTAVQMGTAHVEFLNENTKATQAISSGVSQVISTQLAHGEKIGDIHELLVVRRAGVTQQQVSQNDPPEEQKHG